MNSGLRPGTETRLLRTLRGRTTVGETIGRVPLHHLALRGGIGTTGTVGMVGIAGVVGKTAIGHNVKTHVGATTFSEPQSKEEC